MTKKRLAAAASKWREKHRAALEGAATAVSKTTSGIEPADLYLPREQDLSTDRYIAELGLPGEYPFTRGVQATMYRGRPWTMRQYAGFGTAAETNERYRYLLAQGTTGLSVAFDLPTQMGRDSDHNLSRGEVGRVGVAIDTIEDMEQLFAGIPLDAISTSMTINSTAHILLALYLTVAKRRNVDWAKLKGTVQNDVLKEYIARGTYVYPPGPALRITTDIFEFCSKEVPLWNTISVSGYHIREAGSSAVEEVAFTLANGIAYVDAAIARGLAVDDFAPRVAFFFNCHNNFLEEVAKFRAARRMWAKIMRQRFQARLDRSCMLRFHTQTAGSSLTAQQPEVNIIRTALQAVAAVLGGTQSLHTNSFDEALGLPTEHSALLALRTQQVIAHESGLTQFVDPLCGSFALESLTDEIEHAAGELIQRIDDLGGMVRAIELDVPQKTIEDSAYRYQKAIESGATKIVGVNAFTEQSGAQSDGARALKLNAEVERRQVERLAAFKSRRDAKAVETKLSAVQTAATEGRNLMPPVCDAVEVGVTLGEVSDVLREVFGEYGQASS
ncbi:MAG: methylmalonyl-CoA mutase family protein [Bdellovibrionota bacterium]